MLLVCEAEEGWRTRALLRWRRQKPSGMNFAMKLLHALWPPQGHTRDVHPTCRQALPVEAVTL